MTTFLIAIGAFAIGFFTGIVSMCFFFVAKREDEASEATLCALSKNDETKKGNSDDT